MKKFLAFFMALVLVLSFSACKKNDASTAASVDTTAAPTAAPTEPAAAATPNEKLLTALLSLQDSAAPEAEGPVSVDIRIDLGKLAPLIGLELDAALDLGIFADAKNSAGALLLNAELDKELLADLGLGFSGESLILSSKSLLGDKNYGISLKDLAENLPKSVLNPASGSALALPQEIYDMLAEGGAESLLAAQPSEELQELLKNCLAELSDIVNDSFKDHEGLTETSAEITVADKTVQTALLSLRITGEQLEKYLTAVAEWLNTSAEVKAVFDRVAVEYADQLTAQGADPATLYSDFQTALQEEPVTVDPSLVLTAAFYLEEASGKLLRAELALQSTEQNLTLTAAVLEDSDARCAAEYTVAVSGEADALKLSFDLDRKTGAFTVNALDMITLTGSKKTEGKVTTVKLESLTIDEGGSSMTVKDLGVTVTLDKAAAMPAPGAYDELLTMTEDQLSVVIADILTVAEGILGKVQGALGIEPYYDDPVLTPAF